MTPWPVNIKWKNPRSGLVGRNDHTAVWLNGLVYVGGGYVAGPNTSCIDCFDPAKKSWGPSIHTKYSYFALTTLNNKLVTAGGQSAQYSKRTKEILKVDTDQLESYGYTEMMEARSHATAAGYQGKLIIIGGEDDYNRKLFSTELFDSKSGQWHKCNDLPRPYSELRSVIIDNILYLFGGVNKDRYRSKTVYAASLDTLSTFLLNWNKCKDTPCSRTAPVSVNGTHLLIVGGYKYKGGGKSGCTSEIHKFNTNKWEAIGCIPDELSREGSAAVSIANKTVIVMGGLDDKGVATDTVLIVSFEPQLLASN